jgi:hypothetical protein
MTTTIKPDRQDFEAIEHEHGPLPDDATTQDQADRYRLAQAAKLIRLYEQGKLPLDLMREMDKIPRKQRLSVAAPRIRREKQQ